MTLAYETYGELSPERDNAILLLHALSGDAHAAGWHAGAAKPGWWDAMVGPGRPFDTDRYFVICSNVIGGCQGSTGPSSVDLATGRPYGARFPVLTIGSGPANSLRAGKRPMRGHSLPTGRSRRRHSGRCASPAATASAPTRT